MDLSFARDSAGRSSVVSSCVGAFRAVQPAAKSTQPPAIRSTPTEMPKKLRIRCPHVRHTSRMIRQYRAILLATNARSLSDRLVVSVQKNIAPLNGLMTGRNVENASTKALTKALVMTVS